MIIFIYICILFIYQYLLFHILSFYVKDIEDLRFNFEKKIYNKIYEYNRDIFIYYDIKDMGEWSI